MKIFNKERPLTPSWDLVKPSIELVKNNFWQVVYLSFVPGIILFIGLILIGEDPTQTSDSRLGLGGLIVLGGVIYAALAYPGFTYLQLKAVQGKEISTMECFRKGLPHLPALIGMGILGVALILMGLIALIIPGLLLIRGFALAPYYVVDQNLGPSEALRKSYDESVPVSAWIWGLIGVEVVFAFIASAAGRIAGIGFLLSMAISYIYVFAPALRYVEVTKKTKKIKKTAAAN